MYAGPVLRNFRSILLVVGCAIVPITGCAPDPHQPVDLNKWQREDTIWKSNSGSKVALYTFGMTMGKAAEAIVCEQRDRKSTIIRLPADTFELVTGSELKVVRLNDRVLPGWYRIWRAPGLNWWQRTFSDAPISGWEFIKNQELLQKPPQETSRDAVLSLSAGNWQKVADEKKIRDLLEVPAEGLVYVGEPGIGVVEVIDLPSACS
jgi:hypothetical protein